MKAFDDRKYVVTAIILVTSFIYLIRLFYVQVIDDSYKLSAKNQALRTLVHYPSRGLIYDRNKELLVFNEAAYDLMVTPKQTKGIDTTAFCEIVGITKEEYIAKMEKARSYSSYKASVFEKQIPSDQFTSISEKLYMFSGFYGQKRTLRKYPKPIASHVLGYIGEVSLSRINKNPYYKKSDYIGIRGLEKEYEKELRGKRGKKVLMVDVHSRVKGSYQNGAYDTMAVHGTNLYTSIDRDLQEYAEHLMKNKRGSVVAIEPSTGEILTLVTAPSYDPNFLVGRNRSDNYNSLVANDSLNPLFNRAIDAQYRPGSIFKLVQSLVGLEQGVITKETRMKCNRGIINCHGNHSNDKLVEAIQHSCNPYFYQVYKRLIQPGKYSNIFKDSEAGLNEWHRMVSKFGFGQKLESDIPGISGGLLPDVAFYNHWYGEHRWAFSTIYSNSIGEGEMGVVPIQMANLAATLANKGFYYTPHLVKGIGENFSIREAFTTKHETEITPKYFDPVIEAMSAVVNLPGGTARQARLDSIEICGKTGTVQNPDRPDHSVFICFAPRDNPKIAIAVYVEYSDYGGLWSAPISSLLIEKYLTGKITDTEKEKRMLDAEFLTIYEK